MQAWQAACAHSHATNVSPSPIQGSAAQPTQPPMHTSVTHHPPGELALPHAFLDGFRLLDQLSLAPQGNNLRGTASLLLRLQGAGVGQQAGRQAGRTNTQQSWRRISLPLQHGDATAACMHACTQVPLAPP